MTALLPVVLLITSLGSKGGSPAICFLKERQSTSKGLNNESDNMQNSIEDTIKSKSRMDKIQKPFVLRLSQSGMEKVTTILDSTKSVRMRSGFVTLQLNKNVGSHNTGKHEEILIILHGRGFVDIEGIGKKEIEEGMVVYIPPNNQHDVYGTGSSPLQYIYVVTPVK